MKADVSFWRELKENKPFLTKQQYRTIKGCGCPVDTSRRARSTDRADRRDHAVKGQVQDARKGLKRVVARRNVK